MSDKIDVSAESNSTTEKNVVLENATSTNTQVCLDSSLIDKNVNTTSDLVPSQVLDVSHREECKTDDNIFNIEQSGSLTANDSVLPSPADIKNSLEDDSFVNATSVSSSLQDHVIHQSTVSERAEGSDNGSDYKDAIVSKDGTIELSDSDSHAGSESSSEGIIGGRRNRRPSDELAKDNYSDDDSLGKEETDHDPPGARESGDGEEKGKDKVVDRDEDKKDPQYIPKKGVFYEHDDRTADSGPATTAEEPKDTKKKKIVADKIDRWGHDMFDTDKQSPKTAQDLIDYYGYDIRNEEEPPKAWRSRRYGRGPNKYTRQWQDEAAYRNKRPQSNKPPPPPAPFKNNIDDFPTVEQSKSGYRHSRNRNVQNTRETGGRHRPRSQNKSLSPKEPRTDARRKLSSRSPPPNSSSSSQHVVSERGPTSKDMKYKDIQIEKITFLNKKKPFSSNKTKSEAEAEADLAALSKEFSNAVINLGRDGKILPIGSHGSLVSGPPPNTNVEKVERVEIKEMHEPRLAEQRMAGGGLEMRAKERRDVSQNAVSSKSKRYSSQRQRSLPQSNHLQQPAPPQQSQQQYLHQQQFYPPPPPPQTAPETVPDSALYSGFQGNPPPTVYPDSMQSVVFLPGYPPTPAPHLLNYCPPPPQQFGMPPPLGPPPPDMFPPQPPPGITYYSPQSQVQPRPPASRRVKVAIPIVAPPDQQSHPDQPCS